MKLHTLLHGIALTNLPDTDIKSLTKNSKKAAEGCMFVCIKGKRFDGHDFVSEALSKGAAVIVCEHDLGIENQIIVSDSRQAYSYLCANWFNHPEKKTNIIGVTGTNGKTTITTVLYKAITDSGVKAGLIGTTNDIIGDKSLSAEHTTPEPYELFSLLSQMVSEGCKYVVMEVSSQALEEHRADPLNYCTSVFTNLTQDHLDVHGTMENYYQAKKRIFNSCDCAIINADDEAGRRYFVEVDCKKYSYSVEGTANFYADAIKLTPSGSSFWFSDGVRTYPVSISMPGFFNVSNITAVLACLSELGFDIKKSIDSISDFRGVKGRAEIIETGRDFKIVCDYAHTPDAIEKILQNMKRVCEGRLICLFGCGGNRDRKKRPLMAQAAAKYSDFLIITSDNPRNEEPMSIIKDIVEGLDRIEICYYTEPDREKAILYAIKNAQKDDILVLAGKGHEDYQVVADEVKIHLDEREVVKKGLALLESGQL